MQPSLNLTANSNKVGGSKVLPLNLRGADVGKKNKKNQGKWGNLFCSFDLKTQDRFHGFGHAYCCFYLLLLLPGVPAPASTRGRLFC